MNHRNTTFPRSQNDRIIRYLRKHAGEWISLRRLTSISKAYNVSGRISELRADNFNIVNRKTWKRGVCLSAYKLT